MVTAREVLNGLRWREGFDLGRAEIQISDRTRPEAVRIVRGTAVTELDRRYFSTARARIPYYKIIRIVYDGEVLFERVPRRR